MAQTPTTPTEMTVREAGKKGGLTTRDRYAADGFYATIGHKGGLATRSRHSRDHYVAIGTRGGARVQALLAAGRAAEAKGRKG